MNICHNISDLEQILSNRLSAIGLDKYTGRLPHDYIIDYSVDEIVHDLGVADHLSHDKQYDVRINTISSRAQSNIWQIKLFRLNNPVSLSYSLPIIENFGVVLFDEKPYKIQLSDKHAIYICDFGIEVTDKLQQAVSPELISVLENAILNVFNDHIENDALNSVITYTGLSPRIISLLRAITRYIVQTSLPFSRQYLIHCLKAYPEIAQNIYLMFAAKFDPVHHDMNRAHQIEQKILTQIKPIDNLDDDTMLRAILMVINSMVRTNFYQTINGNPKSYIAFKIASQTLPLLPEPCPLYEIFVYSSRFEAIHLRNDKIARGGLRWSDRFEDFRTEVLGLVKAQIVKNSIIVPSGAKGGFVCKSLPADKNEQIKEAVSCYKDFIRGLLDITDNVVGDKIIAPVDTVCHDDHDPYLVVAADKGTATFSDYANAMSVEYNFWLNDAFASGGSSGYDHKKIGITARGAWESAKRHFRHLGINIQAQDFTVVGIGDMSGDVFGNGMLLSPHIKLIAAFNHQHIFLDPNPDCALSFAERKRLFELTESSWSDYDTSKISHGGGIYARHLKEIPLSQQVKGLLKINNDTLSPNELIVKILTASVDMIYNGGIGTYIKSTQETNGLVRDHANDAVRVNAAQLTARIIVEGGNLGVTQLGRTEFAKCGGLVYTDAIDNSAGVDCSDHEVNIKILFADILSSGQISIANRNKILVEMTDEVTELILRDNYLQTEVVEYISFRSQELFSIHEQFMYKLEKLGVLNRALEFLPDYNEIQTRRLAGIGFSMPELCVLLAYSKNYLNKELLKLPLIKHEMFEELLLNYFPVYLRDNYKEFILRHYLRDQIVANQLANLVVNRMGITFVSRFMDEFRCNMTQIMCAFWVSYKLLSADKIFKEISDLDFLMNANLQVKMFVRFKKTIERLSRWILRLNYNDTQIFELLRFQPQITSLIDNLQSIVAENDYSILPSILSEFDDERIPDRLKQILARTGYIPQLLDVAILSTNTSRNLISVAKNYFYLGRILHIDYLRKLLIDLPEDNKWQSAARSALLSDCYTLYTTFLQSAILSTDNTDESFVDSWMSKYKSQIEQIDDIFKELLTYQVCDLAMLFAIIREIDIIRISFT